MTTNLKSLKYLKKTCNIVSKLKAVPFHKVNSPDEAPVIKRFPSGVQQRE